MVRHNPTLLLVKKDLLRRWRSPLSVLVLIAFPLIFSGMLALAFGGGGENSPIRVKLLLEDRDGGLAGGFIKSFLQAEQVRDFLEVVEVGEDGLERIESDPASALLRIPEGTTEKLADGKAVALELIRNPAQGILPEIAEQVAAILADVLGILTRLLHNQVEVMGLENASLSDFDDLTDEDFARLSVALRRTFEEVSSFLSDPPLDFEVTTLGEEKPLEEEDTKKDDNSPFNIFLFILPGISVYSLFLIGDQMMRDILTETQLGTLKRLLSAPVTAGHVVAAKVLVTATVASLVLVLLAAIAALLADRPVHVPAFILISFALVLSITGFAVTIYSLARTENQGSTFASLFYLFMGFAGGSFLPTDSLPSALRSVAPVSPFYWSTEAYRKLLDGGGLEDVLASIAVLGIAGLILLGLGTVLLHRKVLRGDAA